MHLRAAHVPDDQSGNDGNESQLEVQGPALPLMEMRGQCDAGSSQDPDCGERAPAEASRDRA
jgi:hypothetical protein